MIRIFFLSQSSPVLEIFPFDKITLKSYICTVVTVMAKQCWSQTGLESGSWGHSVLQTPALVKTYFSYIIVFIFFLFLHGNICCGYSLEVPHRDTSNEYPQHMLPWRNKKTVYVTTPLF